MRLYFRGPGGERFLLRNIALPNGLDEVGRELIAQVVESSVVTLLRSSSGLSREQASAEVAREADATTPSRLEAAKPPAPRGDPGTRSFALSVALRYVAESSGPDLGLAHGPGVELGASTLGAFRVRGRLGFERFFEQSLEADALTASVRTSSLRGGVDARLRLAAGHLTSIGVGGGIDIVEVEPGTARADGVTLTRPQSNVVPVARPEFRYELETETLGLSAALFVDVSLVRTHYDLADGSALTRLGAPWLVRPGGGVMLGLSW